MPGRAPCAPSIPCCCAKARQPWRAAESTPCRRALACKSSARSSTAGSTRTRSARAGPGCGAAREMQSGAGRQGGAGVHLPAMLSVPRGQCAVCVMRVVGRRVEGVAGKRVCWAWTGTCAAGRQAIALLPARMSAVRCAAFCAALCKCSRCLLTLPSTTAGGRMRHVQPGRSRTGCSQPGTRALCRPLLCIPPPPPPALLSRRPPLACRTQCLNKTLAGRRAWAVEGKTPQSPPSLAALS